MRVVVGKASPLALAAAFAAVSLVAAAGCELLVHNRTQTGEAAGGSGSTSASTAATGGMTSAVTSSTSSGGTTSSTSSASSTSSSSSSSSGPGPDAGPPPCLTMCNGACTDPTSDPEHCGSCNVKCDPGVACLSGVCRRALFRGAGSGAPCATKKDGSLWCWGQNSNVQTGNGTTSPMVQLDPSVANVVSGPVLYTASTGYAQCVLYPSGIVRCFGSNQNGESGNGGFGGPDSCAGSFGCNAKPVTAGISNVVELSGAGWWNGGSHFCARTADRKVSCWGDMTFCGTPSHQANPTPVAGIDDVAMMASGAGLECALRGDGTVWCWGCNSSGQLGQGDTNAYPGPVQVKGLSGVTIIGASLTAACARAPDGLYCWGDNGAGQVGNGLTDGKPVTLPAKVATTTGLDDVVQVAGGQVTTCALTSAGAVFCWGAPTQVGNGGGSQVPCNGGPCVASPTKANVGGVVVEIAMGDEYAIARLADGSMKAWGGDGSGMIGNPVSMMPDQIQPLSVLNFP
jgi:hypothetical protein